mgnify:CR=1 FL=1
MIDCLSLRMITGLLPQPLDRKDTALDKLTLSMRVQRVKPSPTLAVTARVAELRAAGKDIIGLGAGEPDFGTPAHIRAAAIQAINDGFTRYTAVDGTPALKQAIIAKFKRDNGLDYKPEQILVSCGGKQSFFNLCMALLNPGDEVIISDPHYACYPNFIRFVDGVPVPVPVYEEDGFQYRPEKIEEKIKRELKNWVDKE